MADNFGLLPESRRERLQLILRMHGRSPAKDGYPRGYVFLDLENLAFITGGLPLLSSTCRRQDIEFRAYTTPTHTQASYATHLSTSSEKEATDIRMVWDASECLVMNRDCPEGLLIITDDIFGRTLMHEEHDRVAHVRYDEMLSYQWSSRFVMQPASRISLPKLEFSESAEVVA